MDLRGVSVVGGTLLPIWVRDPAEPPPSLTLAAPSPAGPYERGVRTKIKLSVAGMSGKGLQLAWSFTPSGKAQFVMDPDRRGYCQNGSEGNANAACSRPYFITAS